MSGEDAARRFRDEGAPRDEPPEGEIGPRRGMGEGVIPESEFERVLGKGHKALRRDRRTAADMEEGGADTAEDDVFDRGEYALRTIENVKEHLDLAKKYAEHMFEDAKRTGSKKRRRK